MSEISERIMASIKRKNMSYGELSHITGIAKSALQRYATGETEKIPLPRLEAIAEALNVSAAYLMGWEEGSAPSTEKVHLVPVERSKVDEELMELIHRLTPEQKKLLMALIRGLLDSQ